MRRRLGAAVVGLGVGEAHAAAYAQHPQCELVSLYDLEQARAATLAARLGSGVALGFEELLADSRVDVVSIASYDDAHFEQVVAALDAGKHVFVEKPLCRTPDELLAVAEAWQRNGRPVLTSNLVLRGAPLYRWLRARRELGELGTPYAYDGDYVFGRLHKIIEGWRGTVDDYSVMLGGGIHLVDLMLWVTGERPESVVSIGNDISTRDTSFRYDDFAAATFSFPSGLVGRVTANFGSVHPHQHVVRLFGTKATFLYDDAGARLHTSRAPEDRPVPLDLDPRPASKGDLIPAFVDNVLDGGDLPGVEHEFSVVAACLAADISRREGRPVAIEYPAGVTQRSP